MNVSKQRLIRTIVLDVMLFALFAFLVCIRVFGLFGLFAEDNGSATALATPPVSTPEPIVTPEQAVPTTDAAAVPESAAPTEEPTATPDPVSGLCGSRFPGKFTDGDPISTDTTYQSKNVDVTVAYYETNGVKYQIADIYIQDISCLRTYGIWMSGVNVGKTPDLAKSANAILAVNGDYYSNAKTNQHGWFVRNGEELARYDFSTYTSDLLILYYDGSMEVIPVTEITSLDYDAILARYPYQVWYFGPSLLTADGAAKPEGTYNSTLMTYNPRTAIGYYEPGHYCLLTVEGTRVGSNSTSKGMTMIEMSELFSQLGCKIAYNMDGGGSAAMTFQGATFGNNGRSTSDIICIAEPAAAE